MRWMKIGAACEYTGGLERKTLYGAVKAGKLRAAKIGAGRNLLFADLWIDQWLEAAAPVEIELRTP